MWGRHGAGSLALVLLLIACAGEVSGGRPAPTLAPMVIPTSPSVVIVSGAALTSSTSTTVPPLTMPATLSTLAFDLFERVSVDRYEVEFTLASPTQRQTGVATYQRDPPAWRIVAEVNGGPFEVVVIGASAWTRIGSTPGGALVDSSETFAGLIEELLLPGGLAQDTLEPLGITFGDFALVGQSDFGGESAFEYSLSDPGDFSWWVDESGAVLGGRGTVASEPGSVDIEFVYRWTDQIPPIVPPAKVISEETYYKFLAETDPLNLQTALREVLRVVDAGSRTLGRSPLDSLETVGLDSGWQAGFNDLPPGVVGVEVLDAGILLVGRMDDGRHFCIAISDDVARYGAGYTLEEVASVADCGQADEFPFLAPAG